MSCELALVDAETLPAFMPALQEPFARMAAGSGGRFSAEDVAAAVRDGRALLWLALDPENAIHCCMMTETIGYPCARALRIVGIVGRQPWRWRGLLPQVKQIARDEFGCDRIEAVGPARIAALLGRGWVEWHRIWEGAL